MTEKTRFWYAAHSDMGLGFTYDSPCWLVLAFESAGARNEHVNAHADKSKAVTRREAIKIAPELRHKSPYDAWRVSVVASTSDQTQDNKPSRKPTYIALTTHNAQMSGYNIVLAAGHKRAEVERKARAIIGDVGTAYGTDIYKETEHANLAVVSKTRAKRQYGFDWDEFAPDPDSRYEWVN